MLVNYSLAVQFKQIIVNTKGLLHYNIGKTRKINKTHSDKPKTND